MLSQAQARAERKRAEAQADDTIRVTYVPETVRNQIRDELKQEVLAQAVEESYNFV